ncbi:MAG: FAD:protein FMN transferase [Rhodospirillales bacterium]|jgi:thiamine biosynthesis lipoprotein|nr:FAD:protein FMN transferase [Rhodospirillales bacterium]
MTPLSRRRFIRIAIGGTAVAAMAGTRVAMATVPLRRWKGVALGAAAELVLPAAEADRLIALTRSEIGRLERIFSLYRDDSALVRLNRQGFLDSPPLEMVELLARARAVSAASRGAFDVTVQPLWEAYAAHFSDRRADSSGPSRAILDAALARVDWQAVDIGPARITFGRPGMAVTLNGIAQGYITDKVAERIRAEGFEHILLNLGETRALGSHPDGRPWRVAAIEAPPPVPLVDGAIATSAAQGTAFMPDGAANHIFDPRTGTSAAAYQWISVEAPTATEADAWSTAFSLMPLAAIHGAMKNTEIRRVRLMEQSGAEIVTL